MATSIQRITIENDRLSWRSATRPSRTRLQHGFAFRPMWPLRSTALLQKRF